MKGYIPWVSARATQALRLQVAVKDCTAQILAWQDAGELRGPGPLFVGIGNSLAAAGAAVWTLRERGIEAWRAGAGDFPVPFPPSAHPVVGISQSGRSTETLAVLSAVPSPQRLAVVNAGGSPLSALASRSLHLGDVPDSYASTIGYTATVAALGLLADAWDGGRIDPGWASLPFVAEDLREVVAGLGADAAYADVVAAAPSVGSAECGALLLREVARLSGTPMTTRSYLHGAMESAGPGWHILLGDDREIQVARTLSESGRKVLLITTAVVAGAPNLWTVRIPSLPAGQRAVVESIVLQSLAEAAAAARGIDIEEFVFHHEDTKVAAQ
ncbi:SIS domain-containing protein [Actinoplanes sp. NPDC051411]|uniref:SIS domain-containing protein n=1 Tax=Actinoplanes sp. NPDC051411 TaxID=3155522 RepID=UPI00341D7CC7